MKAIREFSRILNFEPSLEKPGSAGYVPVVLYHHSSQTYNTVKRSVNVHSTDWEFEFYEFFYFFLNSQNITNFKMEVTSMESGDACKRN